MSGKGCGPYTSYWTTPRILKFVISWMIVAMLVIAATKCVMAADPAPLVQNGVTCTDVRKLTWAERRYWIWRLGLTPSDVAAIKAACKIK